MKTKQTKRFGIIVIQFITTEIISFIIQTFLQNKFQNMTIKNVIDNAIIIGTCVTIIVSIILLIKWKIKDKSNEVSLTKRILDIIQKQRYYEHQVIDSQLLNKDESKVLEELKKEMNIPENEIKKMISKYFQYPV
ncbi:MAG: hypothetical protein WC707_06790 [Candidatus Babeliaceae bacterium]|jgi:predicted membrane protein